MALCSVESGCSSGWAEPAAAEVTGAVCLQRLERLQANRDSPWRRRQSSEEQENAKSLHMRRQTLHKAPIAFALALVTCAPQPQADLGTALSGIEQSRFLACSGPPSLDIPQGTQERMWFVTNLKRGETIGAFGPDAAPVESCSVAAVFENSHLANATFSGNQSMCQLVFAPCLSK